MKHFLTLILALLPASGFACSCLYQPLEKNVENSKNIYLGVLISSRIVIPESKDKWPYIEGTFKVETEIKGNLSKIEKIHTMFGGGDCGIPMTTGRAYVIFSEGEDSLIGSCGGSGEVQRYEEKEVVEKLKSIVSAQKP